MIYFIVFIFVIFISRINSFSFSWKCNCVIGILLLSLLAGFRDVSIGTDTGLYVDKIFYSACNIRDYSRLLILNSQAFNTEIGYLTFNYFVSFFTDDLNEYLFCAHLLMISCISFALVKTIGFKYYWVGLFVFCFCFYTETLNIARQSMAIMIDLVCFAFLRERKFLWAVLFFLIGIGFHTTAILFILPVLLFVGLNKFPVFCSSKYKFVLILSIVLCLMLFSTIMGSLVSLGLDSKYEERYASGDMYGTNVPLSLFALNVVNIIYFYIVTQGRKKTHFDHFTEYVLLISLVLCFTGLISTFLVRIGSYFLYLTILLIPNIVSRYAMGRHISLGLFAFYIFYWYMCVVVANLGETYPYASKILGI